MTASEIKESGSLFSPYDVSYSVGGTTICISGGGYSDEYDYDASSDSINTGGTVFYRVY